MEVLISRLMEMHKDIRCPYQSSLNKINFDELHIEGGVSGEVLKKTLEAALKDLQKIRSLYELLDILKKNLENPKKHPDRPKKPLTAINFFIMKNFSKFREKTATLKEAFAEVNAAFKALSAKKRARYEAMAEQAKRERQEQLATFHKNHPELKPELVVSKEEQFDNDPKAPSMAFTIFSESKKGGKRILQADWKKLSASEKLPFVSKALLKSSLSQLPLCDLTTYFEAKGMPQKPQRAYYLFIKDQTGTRVLKEYAVAWKQLAPGQKDKYQRQAVVALAHYKEELQDFLKALTPPERQVFKLRIQAGAKSKRGQNATGVGTPWSIYYKKNFSRYKHLGGKEAMRKLGEKWRAMSAEKKAKYSEMYQEAVDKKNENPAQPTEEEQTNGNHVVVEETPRSKRKKINFGGSRHATQEI